MCKYVPVTCLFGCCCLKKSKEENRIYLEVVDFLLQLWRSVCSKLAFTLKTTKSSVDERNSVWSLWRNAARTHRMSSREREARWHEPNSLPFPLRPKGHLHESPAPAASGSWGVSRGDPCTRGHSCGSEDSAVGVGAQRPTVGGSGVLRSGQARNPKTRASRKPQSPCLRDLGASRFILQFKKLATFSRIVVAGPTDFRDVSPSCRTRRVSVV